MLFSGQHIIKCMYMIYTFTCARDIPIVLTADDFFRYPAKWLYIIDNNIIIYYMNIHEKDIIFRNFILGTTIAHVRV